MNFARGKLMLASFLTLVASGVGFATRTAAGGDWEREFNIGGAEFGAILGDRAQTGCNSVTNPGTIIGKRGITEFNYRFANGADGTNAAHIYVGVEVRSSEGQQGVVDLLKRHNYPVVDMTDNEAAKLHVRHMVGGRAGQEVQELLFRFEFPERPGALLKFLNGLGSDWNISLFHYHNHGSAFGRVLVGFHADAKQRKALQTYLQRIGYRFWEETDNPAYQLFLS